MVKRTLHHLLCTTIIPDKLTLDYAELQVLLYKVANITNNRPVGLQGLTEDKLVPLTVSQFLLGRNSTQRVSYSNQSDLVNLASFSRYHQNLF